MNITKAVIPAAGWGTRLLPITKSIPKEMLPIVDKPVIQYVVEEVVNSGITDIIMVVNNQKDAIKTHFASNKELEEYLIKFNKLDQLNLVQDLAKLAKITYVNQVGPYGNGTPVLCAKDEIGNEPFVVIWGDEFIYSNPPRLKQLLDVYEEYKKPVISAVRVGREKVSRYGIVDIEFVKDNIYKIKRMVEKPSPEEAPSDLAAHGAYILPPKIFNILENLTPGKGGELWLPDAVQKLIEEEDVLACEIKNGKYYDTGNKLEYLKTNVDFGLKNEDIAGEFKNYLKNLF